MTDGTCQPVVDYELNRRIGWEPVLEAASREEDQAGIGDRAEHRWSYAFTPLRIHLTSG